MGYIVAPGSENVPWIRAMIERHEKLKGNATPTGRPDVVEIRNWSPNEWRDQQHLHQQHHHQQQQQQQEQQLRQQQQYQQRQRIFRYRQQQQQQHQYLLQQQHQTSRRWEHQQHCNATAKKTSQERVEARADREDTQAENGGAPPTSQTTSKPQSLSEHPVVLFASQPVCREPSSIDDELLDDMENGLLGKPAKKADEEIFEELVGDSEGPQQSMHAAQPRPCLSVEDTGIAEMGMLGKELVVSGGLVASAGVAGVEEERPPPLWDDTSDISAWWLAPDPTELEIAIFCAQTGSPAASREMDDGKMVLGEDGEHAPPLLQQQQELQAAPPQEPWPPPIAAEQEGSGAGPCGEDGLGLEGFSITRLDFSFACGSDGVLSFGNGYYKESSGMGDDEEDTVDGRVWERVGIGTGARSRAFWGSEVALRRLTQRRRERVREK